MFYSTLGAGRKCVITPGKTVVTFKSGKQFPSEWNKLVGTLKQGDFDLKGFLRNHYFGDGRVEKLTFRILILK